MKFPILKEDRLPGTIDRDRITIETPWGPMDDRMPGHRKQLFLAIAFRQNRPMSWRVCADARSASSAIRRQTPIANFYHIYRIEHRKPIMKTLEIPIETLKEQSISADDLAFLGQILFAKRDLLEFARLLDAEAIVPSRRFTAMPFTMACAAEYQPFRSAAAKIVRQQFPGPSDLDLNIVWTNLLKSFAIASTIVGGN